MAYYRILFSDIDGTLLNSKSQISADTLQAIQSLNAIKIPFVLVSARMPKGMETFQHQIGVCEAMICFSGALVLGPRDAAGHREVIRDITLRREDVENVYQWIKPQDDITLSVYTKDDWYVDELNEVNLQESEITSIKPVVCGQERIFDIQHINKILCIGNPQHINRLQTDISKNYPKLTVYKSKPTYLEIMAPQVSKSSAMKDLLTSMDLTMDRAVSIGDYYNDIDMLQNAGLGIAMGNAPDEVKMYADEITASNDHNGLKLVIDKYFLNGGV